VKNLVCIFASQKYTFLPTNESPHPKAAQFCQERHPNLIFCQNGSLFCLEATFCHQKAIGTALAIGQVNFENKKINK